MKTSSLPEIDLARIAPMERDQKRRELEKMKAGRPPYSYRPVRTSILDILNIAAGPLVSVPRTPWNAIAADIRRNGASAAEIDANLRVAEGLYKYASDQNLIGRRQDFLPLNLGISEKVVYWSPLVMDIDGVPVVPFFDPRRTKKLTFSAHRFVFSVMHERIRALDPAFANVRLAIFQFVNSENGPRAPNVRFDDEVELFSVETLDQMVRETYALWYDVLRARDDEIRRRSGERGDLL